MFLEDIDLLGEEAVEEPPAEELVDGVDTLAINDDPVISDKYLFGFKTYYEDDPIREDSSVGN